jgi:hypothetical protein
MKLTRPDGTTTVYARVESYSPSASQLDEFAGIYRSDEMDAVYRIRVQDGRLRLERPKVRPGDFTPVVADTFSGPSNNVLRFTRDGQGRVNGFVLEAGRVRGVKFWKDTRPARPSNP